MKQTKKSQRHSILTCRPEAGTAIVVLLLSLALALFVASDIVLVHFSNGSASVSSEPADGSPSPSSSVAMPTGTSQAMDSRAEPLAIPRLFFNTNICSIDANPYDGSIRVLYCTLVPAQNGAVYAFLSNVYENTNGEMVNSDLYVTRSSENPGPQSLSAPQDQLWLYDHNRPVRQVLQLDGDSSSSISAVFVSPGEKMVAVIVSGKAVAANMVNSSSVLELAGIDGTPEKVFSPLQLGVTSGCHCSASILGWGNEYLWLTLARSANGSLPLDFLTIDIKDWLVAEYPTTIYDLSAVNFQDLFNFDSGELLTTDLEYGPLFAPYGSSSLRMALDHEVLSGVTSSTVFSISLYDLKSGENETLETTTAAIAAYHDDPEFRWLDDETFQYFDFSRGLIVTSTAL